MTTDTRQVIRQKLPWRRYLYHGRLDSVTLRWRLKRLGTLEFHGEKGVGKVQRWSRFSRKVTGPLRVHVSTVWMGPRVARPKEKRPDGPASAGPAASDLRQELWGPSDQGVAIGAKGWLEPSDLHPTGCRARRGVSAATCGENSGVIFRHAVSVMSWWKMGAAVGSKYSVEGMPILWARLPSTDKTWWSGGEGSLEPSDLHLMSSSGRYGSWSVEGPWFLETKRKG